MKICKHLYGDQISDLLDNPAGPGAEPGGGAVWAGLARALGPLGFYLVTNTKFMT